MKSGVHILGPALVTPTSMLLQGILEITDPNLPGWGAQ